VEESFDALRRLGNQEDDVQDGEQHPRLAARLRTTLRNMRTRPPMIARSSLISAAAAALSLAACADLDADAGADHAFGIPESNGIRGTNTMAVISGLVPAIGLSGPGGSDIGNGLSLTSSLSQGLASTNGFMTTEAGRKTVAYLVKCALASNDTLFKTDERGRQYAFGGQLGLCPQWKTGGIATDRACQNMVSACMMAFVNSVGVQIPIWITSEHPKIGWGLSPSYPLQEGTFFGNILLTGTLGALGMPGTTAPKAYFCGGTGSVSSIVAGRLDAFSPNTPYVNPYGTGSMCTAGQTVPGPTTPGKFDPDGFKRACVGSTCFENGEPITVWRNNVYTPGFDSVYRYALSPMHVGGKAIDVASGATANGTAVQQYAGVAFERQRFAILKSGTSSNWQLAMKIDTNKCIGPVGNGTDNGTLIEIQDCNAGNNQAWTITASMLSAGFMLKNVASNRCLEVAAGGTADGTPLQLFDCNTGNNQKFKLSVSF
jgi:hypothetical protein